MLRSSLRLFFVLSFCVSFSLHLGERRSAAEETPFPILPGLEEAVEFWKLVFTNYSTSELIFHDPREPGRMYSVLTVAESNKIQPVIDKEKERIVAEFGLVEEERKVRAQRGVRERFVAGLELSGKYMEQMQKIFREAGLPVELAYLPLVESSFNVRARSRAGAVGIWQFMPLTGKRYLHVGPTVDERRDPFESTRAAARFLKENHRALGNWPLAITAYNHGRDGMLRAVAEVESRDLVEIIRRYQGPAFGFASKNFYAEFLAAVEVAKNSDYYFPGLKHHPPFPLEEVEVIKTLSVQSLLNPLGISRKEFLDWNPALVPRIRSIPAGYRVKLPEEKVRQFLMAYRHHVDPVLFKRTVPAKPEQVKATKWAQHRVAPGETLSGIARLYRISVRALQRANGLANIHSISAGQHLKIPIP